MSRGHLSPEQYELAQKLFLSVFDLDSAARAAYLDDRAADMPAVRAEVDALLGQHDEDTTFLTDASRPPRPTPPTADTGWGIEPGDRIGPYTVLRVIGEGGFGLVCEAEQTVPMRRRAALKILKAGMDTSQVIARFDAERQALAVMDHPYIAKVFDAGATDGGRPYFVMEYVDGVPITEYCDDCRLTTEARLRLFTQVCEAIQHAHQKGIIHRDIKPSNVLVTGQDGKPAAKVIDFGIAKAADPRPEDGTRFTALGQLVGTPPYMSPEQALGSLDVDTRSDIYSLGALLYELLTGSPPLDPERIRGVGFAEVQRVIGEQEPEKPSTRITKANGTAIRVARARCANVRGLQRELRGDLDWIVLRALEKDRSRRYATAAGLGADIRRHLSHEPVVAGPPSRAYWLMKFARRNRAGVAATLIVGLVLAVAAAGTWRALEARQTQAEVTTKMLSFLGDVFIARAAGSTTGDSDREVLRQIAHEIDNGAFADRLDILAKLHGMLAYACSVTEQLSEAEANWQRALELRSQVLGEEHASTLATMNSLASVLLDQDKPEQAEELSRKAVEACRRELGESHWTTQRALGHLGTALFDGGKLAEAEAVYEEATEIAVRTRGPRSLSTARLRRQWGQCLMRLERYEESRAQLEQAMKIVDGADSKETAKTAELLAELFEAWGKPDEAAAYRAIQ